MRKRILVILIGWVIMSMGFDASAIEVQGDFCSVFIREANIYRYPPAQRIDHPSALSASFRIRHSGFSFTPSNDQFWLEIPVANTDTVSIGLLYELVSPLIDELQFFWATADTVIASPKMGDTPPFSALSRTDPHFVFPFEIASGQEGRLYVMALKPSTSMVLKSRLWGDACLKRRFFQQEVWIIAFEGMLIMLLLFSVVMFIYLRSMLFLHYANYLLASILITLLLSGYGLLIVWRDAPALNNPGYFLPAYFILSIFLYIVGYCGVNKDKRLQLGVYLITGLTLFTMGVSLVIQYLSDNVVQALIYIANIFFPIVVLWLPYAVWKRYQVDRDRTYFVVLGLFFLSLLNLVLYSMEQLGVGFANVSLLSRGMPVIFIEAILFLLLIGLKFKKRQDYVQLLELDQQRLRLEAADLLLQGQEIERQRIAEELHDNVGTRFSLLKMKTERLIRQSSEHTSDLLQGILEQVNALKHAVRKLSHDLHPINLESRPLAVAIDDLCYDIEQATGIEILRRVQISDTIVLPIALKKAVFLSLSELLNNAVKYAEPSTIRVELTIENAKLQLVVADNGLGFDQEKITEGLGFQNINARAALYNGTFDIASNSAGSTFTLSLSYGATLFK